MAQPGIVDVIARQPDGLSRAAATAVFHDLIRRHKEIYSDRAPILAWQPFRGVRRRRPW